MANNLDLSISNLRDRDLIAEITGSTFNLDLLVEELLEGGQIEDLVAYGLRAVDGVLLTYQRRPYLVSLGSIGWIVTSGLVDVVDVPS